LENQRQVKKAREDENIQYAGVNYNIMESDGALKSFSTGVVNVLEVQPI
jgi:hypothetical protein